MNGTCPHVPHCCPYLGVFGRALYLIMSNLVVLFYSHAVLVLGALVRASVPDLTTRPPPHEIARPRIHCKHERRSIV